MGRDPIGRLREILKQEKQVFISGDYAKLAEIAEEKEHLVNDLRDVRPSRKDLQDLRQSMAHNQRLAEAALEGVQSAKVRIGALMQVQAGLTTYDPDGKVAQRNTGTTTVERKA